jgi:hypothetical protein
MMFRTSVSASPEACGCSGARPEDVSARVPINGIGIPPSIAKTVPSAFNTTNPSAILCNRSPKTRAPSAIHLKSRSTAPHDINACASIAASWL